MPLKIQYPAAKVTAKPRITTGINKGLSWLLKALNKIEGPKKQRGREIARYRIPFPKTSFFLLIL